MNTYTKWEYQQVDANFANLNVLGGAGWELCLFRNINGYTFYILKRPIVEQTNSIENVEKAVEILDSIKKAKKKLGINFKVGDWVISKSGHWFNSYEIAKVKNDKVFLWVDGKICNSPYFKDDMVACVDFKSYPKHNGKPVKKINPNNPNNIRKGDWVCYDKDSQRVYQVYSVKNGKLVIIYKNAPFYAWSDKLKSCCKVTGEQLKVKAKVF